MQIGAIVDNIKDGSIADEIGLDIGDEIISVNKKKPRDIIDYSFLIQDELIELLIKKKNGDEEIIEIEKDYEEDLGVSFTRGVFDRIKPCANRCIFCFVDQQPKGLRESLYVKDDDWRLSYLQGTYITFTNFREEDWERLEKLKLSPLYVSIHTTNPELRSKMLNNKRAGEILSCLKRLKKNHIDFHGQIVLCPGFNDGKELKRTLDDLSHFKSVLKSLAVVPVGISKYRKEKLKSVDKKIASETIDLLDEFNTKMKKNIACASDEFFMLSEREIPPKKYYGNFSQIEDGVGAIRMFLEDFKKSSGRLKKKIKNKTKLTLATGVSGCKIFEMIKDKIKVENFEFEIIGVKNKFFGDKINVTGLVVGQDLIDTLRGRKIEHLAIPSIMLREGSDEFLDGKTLKDVEDAINAPIHVINDCYKFEDFVTIINSFLAIYFVEIPYKFGRLFMNVSPVNNSFGFKAQSEASSKSNVASSSLQTTAVNAGIGAGVGAVMGGISCLMPISKNLAAKSLSEAMLVYKRDSVPCASELAKILPKYNKMVNNNAWLNFINEVNGMSDDVFGQSSKKLAIKVGLASDNFFSRLSSQAYTREQILDAAKSKLIGKNPVIKSDEIIKNMGEKVASKSDELFNEAKKMISENPKDELVQFAKKAAKKIRNSKTMVSAVRFGIFASLIFGIFSAIGSSKKDS